MHDSVLSLGRGGSSASLFSCREIRGCFRTLNTVRTHSHLPPHLPEQGLRAFAPSSSTTARPVRPLSLTMSLWDAEVSIPSSRLLPLRLAYAKGCQSPLSLQPPVGQYSRPRVLLGPAPAP